MEEIKELTPEEVKALQAENKKMTAELIKMSELLAKNAEQVASLGEKLREKSEAYDQLAAENAALLTEVAAQKQIIADLNQALIEKEVEVQASAKYPVFKIGKASYELVISKFIHKFKGERIEVDKDVLAQNKELLAELVAKGSGALKLKGGI